MRRRIIAETIYTRYLCAAEIFAGRRDLNHAAAYARTAAGQPRFAARIQQHLRDEADPFLLKFPLITEEESQDT